MQWLHVSDPRPLLPAGDGASLAFELPVLL